MTNKQIQKAGANSEQFQAVEMTVNIGIDEKRAREIYQEMNLQLRRDYSAEALIVANSRVSEFENRLLPRMESVEGALKAFADPSFQLLLVEAQKAAASTERPVDYDLLSELLIHRFQKGENRVTRAGISRAVEVVDKISDEALLGLTVFHSVTHIFPSSGDIYQGLNALNDLFGKIIYGKLPVGYDWLDHLDILDAVRVDSSNRLKTIYQYYSEMLAGYIEEGIENKSEDYVKAIELLQRNSLPEDLLVEHALNNNFSRLSLSGMNSLDSLTIQFQSSQNGNSLINQIPISDIQKEAIKSIYKLYRKDAKLRQQNIEIFMEEWNKRQNLNTLSEWWASIDYSIQITSVGKILAHANAQRCNKDLPPLD